MRTSADPTARAMAVVFAGVTERELLASVLKTAWRAGWCCYHTYASARSEKGFPDLVAVRTPRAARPGPPFVVFAELKTEAGRLTTEQRMWAAALRGVEDATGGFLAYRLWRPSDKDAIAGFFAEGVIEE